jgi:hypothetical protein
VFGQVTERKAILQAGVHRFFSLSGNPNLKPIEILFAGSKMLLRKAGKHPITDLWQMVGQMAADVTAKECTHFIQHAEYIPT